jgi:hypothetical protein
MRLELAGEGELRYVLSTESVELEPGESRRIAVFAFVPVDRVTVPGEAVVRARGDVEATARSRFLRPR